MNDQEHPKERDRREQHLQKKSRRAQPDRDAGGGRRSGAGDRVDGRIAESAKEGLLALTVGTGLQVMAAMFEKDVARLCGPDGKNNPDRAGYRHGTGAGSVTLGGRRLPVIRPRTVRGAAPALYGLFSSTEVLGQLALEKMLAGLSSRRYVRGREPAGHASKAPLRR